ASLDPVAAKGVLAPHQRSDTPEIVGERGDRQCPARGIEAAKIAVAGARIDNMRGNEEPRSFYKPGIERVTQIDRRPFRIEAAEIAQGRKNRSSCIRARDSVIYSRARLSPLSALAAEDWSV